jgi:hypothetical protein
MLNRARREGRPAELHYGTQVSPARRVAVVVNSIRDHITVQQDAHSSNDGALNEQMLSMIVGSWVAQTVRAVADVSLADHLVGESLTASD